MEDKLQYIINDGLGDSQITEFGWSLSGEDLWIKLLLPDGTFLKITFIWVTSLLIDMNFGEYFGTPLVYSTKFTNIDQKRWHVKIELGVSPEGQISFECNDIK